MQNLEPLAARTAMEIVQQAGGDAEKFLRRAAMVLASQGLFAFGLFLTSSKEQNLAQCTHARLHRLLQEVRLAPTAEAEIPEPRLTAEYFRTLVSTQEGETDADAVYRILLLQRVIGETLDYGIYYAKAPDRVAH